MSRSCVSVQALDRVDSQEWASGINSRQASADTEHRSVSDRFARLGGDHWMDIRLQKRAYLS